jgi:hypothetical protein
VFLQNAMTQHLTKQQYKVYTFILNNRGCTTRDIQTGTGIECPSGRISEMRAMGVHIISIGKRKYPGAHAFECYAIGEPLKRTVSRYEYVNGVMVERRVQEAL